MTNLIIALDNLSEEQAKQKIQEISDSCSQYMDRIIFKVNDLLALKWLEGIKSMVDDLGWNINMMLDPKWHDIPKTMRNYFKQLSVSWLAENSEYVTIHASNEYSWMKAAVDAKKEFNIKTKILAVTALTSLGEKWVQAVFDDTAKHAVLKMAKMAFEAWVDGIVCSPVEVDVLREIYGEEFIIVNPGIRFEDGDHHDQKRVLTPKLTKQQWSTDGVMWRWILEASDTKDAIYRYFDETEWVEYRGNQNKYEFEKLLYTGNWKELLSYIGAFYFRPEGWKYCRLASGLLSNAYINIGATERSYLVMERAGNELASQVHDKNIEADIVMGAQMWSIRSSLVLAEKLWIEDSIYTEKAWSDNKDMELKRHKINLEWKRVILSEDIVTKWSTLKKMIELVEIAGWKVVAIACVWNRYWKDNFNGVPLVSCYEPQAFDLYWDENTPEEQRKEYPKLPDNSEISPKPKNEWDDLVSSMRK